MADLKSDIIKILQQAGVEIVGNMSAKGVNASGRTAASIRVEDYGKGVRLVGGNDSQHVVSGKSNGEDVMAWDTAPIPTLETGVPPLSKVPKGFYYIIKQWSRDKGITFAKESERQTFAYFVAKKIIKEGTRRSREPIDIYTTPTQKAVTAVKNAVKSDISNTIHAAFAVNIKTI